VDLGDRLDDTTDRRKIKLHRPKLSWWIGFSQIISPSELLFGVLLLLRFCVIIIYCALN
jgi:hypothetical protein